MISRYLKMTVTRYILRNTFIFLRVIFCGLKNVTDHLEPGGLLVLSVHPPHEDRDFNLANGIIYSQRIGKYNGGSDHFFIEKTYSFRRNDSLLAEETLTLGFYKNIVFLKMLADVGFKPLGMAETGKFFVFEKLV